MKVRVAEQYPAIQVSHEGVIYRAGDEPVVHNQEGRHWARAGWIVVIDEGVQPELDLSKLSDAVADIQNAAAGLEAAEAQLEQAAGPAAQPRGGRSGSAERSS